MHYSREILKKNRIWVFIYISLGIFNAFLANYKADFFQRVIDGLADQTLAFSSIILYGVILLVNYCMNYLDNYPETKLDHGIYLDFKLLALRKISTIDYVESLFSGLRMAHPQEEMSYFISGYVSFAVCFLRLLLACTLSGGLIHTLLMCYLQAI